MIDMARANVEAVLDLSQQVATAKAPSDVVELWTTRAQAIRDAERTEQGAGSPYSEDGRRKCRNDNAALQPGLPESLLKEPKELREWPGHIKSSSAW
jgi:hypothetical protein